MPIEGDVTRAVQQFLRWPRTQGNAAVIVSRLHEEWLRGSGLAAKDLGTELRINADKVRKVIERINKIQIPAFRKDTANQDLRCWSIGNIANGRGYTLAEKENKQSNKVVPPLPDPVLIAAVEKLHEDFKRSACGDFESLSMHRDRSREIMMAVLREAYASGRSKKLSIDGRFAAGNVKIPMLRSPDLDSALEAREIDRELWADPLRNLQDFTVRFKIKVGCPSIAVGPLAVLKRLAKRGVAMDICHSHPSGRSEVLSLSAAADMDFVIVPDAAFCLSGKLHAKRYGSLFPITRELQVVLYKPDGPGRRKLGPEIYVYQDSSADVGMWFLAHRNRLPRHIWAGKSDPGTEAESVLTRKPVWIDWLGDLIEKGQHLKAGDAIIAWEPLATGLQEADATLLRGAPHTHYFSLICRDDWNNNDGERFRLLDLREDFKKVFLYEWKLCCKYPQLAEETIRNDTSLLWDFAQGSGLNPEPPDV